MLGFQRHVTVGFVMRFMPEEVVRELSRLDHRQSQRESIRAVGHVDEAKLSNVSRCRGVRNLDSPWTSLSLPPNGDEQPRRFRDWRGLVFDFGG